MKYVYVAAPYKAGDQMVNVREAILAGDRLRKSGLVPYIPHLNFAWHLLGPRLYEDWIAMGLAWVDKCDALVRLPGPSAGADREVARALELGIPVFASIDALEAELRMARAAVVGKEA